MGIMCLKSLYAADNFDKPVHFLQEIEKSNNLAATLLSNNDLTTGIKSQVQALGSGNPFTIKTTGNTVSSATVQGGKGFAISSYD